MTDKGPEMVCETCGGIGYVPAMIETNTGSSPCPYIGESCPDCTKPEPVSPARDKSQLSPIEPEVEVTITDSLGNSTKARWPVESVEFKPEPAPPSTGTVSEDELRGDLITHPRSRFDHTHNAAIHELLRLRQSQPQVTDAELEALSWAAQILEDNRDQTIDAEMQRLAAILRSLRERLKP